MLSHLVHQAPVISSLLASAHESFRSKSAPIDLGRVLGQIVEETVPPRPRRLVDAYIRHTGGDPSSYRNVLPAHMFPQWAMPAAARTLHGSNLPLTKVMNAGCRLEVRASLPSNLPLLVRAKLDRVDNDGRRILLEQEVITGTKECPDAVIARLFAYVPLTRKADLPTKTKKEPSRALVGDGAREMARWRVSADAGIQFAALTGDINPIHWSGAYARAFGFSRPILHGFSGMARTIEGLQKSMFSGDASRIREVSVRFVRPLPLPAIVGLFIDGPRLWIGESVGGAAYLTGEFHTGSSVPGTSANKELS